MILILVKKNKENKNIIKNKKSLFKIPKIDTIQANPRDWVQDYRKSSLFGAKASLYDVIGVFLHRYHP